MSKSFFNLICGLLICAATMTAQAQDANAKYHREIQVDSLNGKYGLMFRNELIVPYEFDTIIAQKDNQGFISKKGGKSGIIAFFIIYDKNVTENMHQSFQQRRYFFEEKGKGKKAKGINLFVTDIPCVYDEIKLIDGRYWVGKGDLKGVFNSAGGTIIRCEYDEIKLINGRYWVGKGDSKGVFNSAGGTIIRCEYAEIKLINGRYWVSKRNLKGVFNSAGGTILRCEFDKIELRSDGKYVAYKNEKKSLYNSAGGRLQTDSDVVYSTD